jgi:hypothetical protein
MSLSSSFDFRSDQANDYQIGICGFSDKHTSVTKRTKTGWLEVRIMCPSGAICLPVRGFKTEIEWTTQTHGSIQRL